MLQVLFLCAENACRSQMAEGLVNRELAGEAQAFSAGVRPGRVNPWAVQAMAELSSLSPKPVDVASACAMLYYYRAVPARGPWAPDPGGVIAEPLCPAYH